MNSPPGQAVDMPRGIAFSLYHSLQSGQAGITRSHFGRAQRSISSSVTVLLYGLHAGRLTRGRQPLCIPMWKELRIYFKRKKNQVTEQHVKYDSIYKQRILYSIHTHTPLYYSISPSTGWLYPPIYDSSRLSLEIEQASLIY